MTTDEGCTETRLLRDLKECIGGLNECLQARDLIALRASCELLEHILDRRAALKGDASKASV